MRARVRCDRPADRARPGASTGVHEAVELRDGGAAWGGKGVTQAVANVNGELRDAVAGLDAADQAALDRALIDADGTPNKGRLGANAILGVSLAAAKAAAAEAGVPLYRHLGGDAARVAARADAERDQRRRARRRTRSTCRSSWSCRPGASTFAEAMQIGAEVYHALSAVLHERGLATGGRRRGRLRARPALERGGDRGDPRGRRARRPPRPVAIALDPATSEVFRDGAYRFEGRELDGRRARRTSGAACSTASRSSRSRTAPPRTTGTPGSG